MGLLRFEVDGQKHELDPASLTMGEKWMLTRDFGIDWASNDFDYGGVVGMLVIAVMRADPVLSEPDAKAMVLGLTDAQVKVEHEPDPPIAAANGAGGQGKTRRKSGNRSTPASTA